MKYRLTYGSGCAAVKFEDAFFALNGFGPLSWQSRLFSEHFARGVLPTAVDIPTGLGKTAVMSLWLIARANGIALPRRLVYVVDRRAVVDQATVFATSLRQRLDGEAAFLKVGLRLGTRSLPISTLRGQYADNREWLEDPASPAIVVATVDMIGSRLLFEGYGVSRKMRPYHAGLLGADALIMLDEAHLVPPFERLIETIETNLDSLGPKDTGERDVVPPFRLLSLSATGGDRVGDTFRLEGSFNAAAGERADLDDAIVERRLNAKKVLTLVKKPDSMSLDEALARETWKLAGEGSLPVRCLVFSDSRETAEKALGRINTLAKGDKRRGVAAREISTEFLVGARRVRERQSVSESWLAEHGFLAGGAKSTATPTFLFATSAGEVGVDLDADHIVCDIVAWERLVQRLGRVNRRGERASQVVIVDEGPPQPKKQDAPTLDELASIRQYDAIKDLLEALPAIDGRSKLGSPEALRQLKQKSTISSELAAKLRTASTAAPLRPELTRAVVEAWSMTSLEEHTGRPEIAPWLRGWVDETPQTSVIWRTHLPVRRRTAAAKSEIQAFFEAAPPHVSEQLSTEVFAVADWLRERASALVRKLSRSRSTLEDELASGDSAMVGEDSHATGGLSRIQPIAFLLSQAGDLMDSFSIEELSTPKEDRGRYRLLERKLGTLRDSMLVVDARFGGVHRGVLDDTSSDPVETADSDDDWAKIVGFRVRPADAADENEGREWQQRYCFTVDWDASGDAISYLLVDKWRGNSANEEDRATSRNHQLLEDHHRCTESKARSLAERLGLRADISEALAIAARLHDEGKRSRRWQRAFRAPSGSSAPYAKTKGPIDFALLDGYRHEFGSLTWVEKDASYRALPEVSRDLVQHLVAAHHGQARPVISTRSCDDAPPSMLEERAQQVALRFARLQALWGPWGLAWLEALLRAADQQASRENDERKQD
jgi:CRISPR-associated endonuclease/helicase Cas3